MVVNKCSIMQGKHFYVTVIYDNKKKSLKFSSKITIDKIITRLGLPISGVIVLSNNEPIPIDNTIQKNACIEIIRVHSGG